VWLGRAFGWCILILTLAVGYEVFVRYVLNSPTVWSLDMQIQMYGALFLMTGPYALAQGAHVRGDFLYRLYPVKWQATSDLILYVIFFIPGMFALVYAGYTAADESWRWKEVSLNSPAGIQIYYLKTLVPIIGFFMLSCSCRAFLKCCVAGRRSKQASGCHVCLMLKKLKIFWQKHNMKSWIGEHRQSCLPTSNDHCLNHNLIEFIEYYR